MLENMTTEMWIGIIAFVAGLVLVFGAAFRKQAGWKINPVWSGVIGVILVVFGGATGILPMIPEAEEVPPTNIINLPGVTVPQPTFSIDVENGTVIGSATNRTKVSISDDEKSATLAFTVDLSENEISAKFACVNFTVTPLPSAQATADSLATIYFETDYLMKYGGEYVLTETSDVYWANWSYSGGDSDDSTSDYDGSMTMLMTETGWCQIDYQLDDGTDSFGEEVDSIGDSGSWTITLHNEDWSWSYPFTVNWICIGTQA